MTDRTGSSAPLAEKLIAAGMEILLSGQPLTLRGAAARAGVSHGAPAHHFDGLSGLQTAIATRAFREFSRYLQDALEEPVSDGPLAAAERLRNLGKAYCRFAADQGALFHLMFVTTEIDRENDELASAMEEAYVALRTATAPFAQGRNPAVIETLFWSIAHGYAMLGFSERPHDQPLPYGAPPLDELMKIGILTVLQPAPPPKNP